MSDTTEKSPTLVTFLLDRSTSMGGIWDDTIDGFNAYLKALQSGGEVIKFTRLQFDFWNSCQIQKGCVAEPVATVVMLNKRSYRPRGLTPLIEAAHKTIHAVEASLEKFDVKHNVVVCIQTDGEENASSPEYTWEGLKALIEEKTRAGWVFNFMGTGIDAYAQGGRMGIAPANTMSTGTSREHVTASYASMGASNLRFAASGDVALSAFTPAERRSSGEPLHGTPSPAMQGMATPLDLAPGGFGGLAGTTKSAGDNLDLTP